MSMLLLSALIAPRSLWSTLSTSFFILALWFFLLAPTHFSYTAHISIFFDQLSILLIIISLWLAGLILIARQKYLNVRNPQKFIFFIILLTLTLVIAFSSRSMLLFYIFFEASLIPTLILILGWGYQPERLQARMYLIMYTVTASLPLLLSVILLLKSLGHTNIIYADWFININLTLSNLWWLIIILAFVVKTPLYLTHLWLPKAHVEAPVAGSIVLAGVLLKLGSYGLMRISFKLSSLAKATSFLIMSISLIGGIITRFICVRQTDIKALIAYSSVRHIGLATAGIISNTQWGWQGAFAMLIAHGFCSSCMFSLANITYETVNSRSIYLAKGLITFFPSMTFWWFCFSACNIAAPPSLNLGAEVMLITRSISFFIGSVFPLGLIAFIAAAYSLFLYTSSHHGAPATFQNPLSLFSPRNYSICILHLIPLIFIVMKLDLVTRYL